MRQNNATMSIQDAPVRPFWLVVEQNTGSSDSMRWGVQVASELDIGVTRAQARHQAERLAYTFSPRHPMLESSRTVLRLTEDSFLTIVEGATATFHFRVSVAEQL